MGRRMLRGSSCPDCIMSDEGACREKHRPPPQPPPLGAVAARTRREGGNQPQPEGNTAARTRNQADGRANRLADLPTHGDKKPPET